MKVRQELVKIVHQLENTLRSGEATKVTLSFSGQKEKPVVIEHQIRGDNGSAKGKKE